MPVLITRDLLCKIMKQYDVSEDFWHVLSAFGRSPSASGGKASGFKAWQEPGQCDSTNFVSRVISCLRLIDREAHCFYRFQYIENNNRSKTDPWSPRHTGVYHLQKPGFDMYLIIQPTDDSVFEQQLLELSSRDAPSSQMLEEILAEPLTIHAMLLLFYLDNWRGPLRDFDKQIEKTVSRIARYSESLTS